jgi:membrane protease YdiL (CAAX protease family)
VQENDLVFGQPASLPGRRANWLERFPLISFFVLAFAFSWAIMVPMILDSRGIIAFKPPIPVLILMGYGPTLAALVVTAAVAGRPGIRALLRRLLIWRVGLRWYLVAIFLNAGIVLAALGLLLLSGGTAPSLPALGPGLLVNVVVTFLVVGLINGEEMGWRGFALPRLLSRWSALVASLILGTFQAFFHLPIFFNQGPSQAGGQSGMPFPGFWISAVAGAILFTWLFNNTRGSILMAWVFHASMNTWTEVVPIASGGLSFWMLVGVQCLVAAVVVAVFGPRRLSRLPDSAIPFVHRPEGTIQGAGDAAADAAPERAA